MKLFKKVLLITVSLLLAISFKTTIVHGQISNAYIDPSYFTKLPFGSYSQWLQPWRAYQETVLAKDFVDGIGINWSTYEIDNPELVAQMLAKHGFTRARLEIGWGDLDYSDENRLLKYKETQYQEILKAFRKYQIRPLILLNAHQGAPNPVNFFQRQVTANAAAGANKIQLNDVSGLIVGRSGLSNLTDYWAAENLITAISGNEVTLSKPLSRSISAGTSMEMATIKYRPFSVPGSIDYEQTIAGWKKYVGTVSRFVSENLGTEQSQDKGFDLEIWNELTFGSHFLYINDYYAGEPYKYKKQTIWDNLVQETVAYVEANSGSFQGVELGNGFANTIPWVASSQQPERITAISKHPYRDRRNYPNDVQKHNTAVDVKGNKTNFNPNYSALFPEFLGTGIETETLVRDMGPITNDLYGVKHGRNARVINGQVVPTDVWITEVNIEPKLDNPNISAKKALDLKGKAAARYFCFYLNKGVTQLYLYTAVEGDTGYGIVKQNFINYSKRNKSYPLNDRQYVSPAMAVTKNITAKMKEGLDRNLNTTRPLDVVSVRAVRAGFQFQGDGSSAHPRLNNEDVFTFLPFQVNSKKFVVPYYVMTRDINKPSKQERFDLELKGINQNGVSIKAYDPIRNRQMPVQVKNNQSPNLLMTVTASDYPYLLIIEEK